MTTHTWSRPPVFQEIEVPPVPEGYVLVAGADVFTELNILRVRSTYGHFLTSGGGPVISAPPPFDPSGRFTGWNNIGSRAHS